MFTFMFKMYFMNNYIKLCLGNVDLFWERKNGTKSVEICIEKTYNIVTTDLIFLFFLQRILLFWKSVVKTVLP